MADRRARVQVIGDASSFIKEMRRANREMAKFTAGVKASQVGSVAMAEMQVTQAIAAADAMKAQAAAFGVVARESSKLEGGARRAATATNMQAQAQAKQIQMAATTRSEVDRLNASLKRHEAQTGRTVRGALAGAGAFTQLGRSIAYASGTFLVFAVAAGALRAAVGAAAQFQHTLNTIVGLAGGARKQVQAFGQELLSLGPKVGQTPQQLADALYFVASAGIDVDKQMETVTVSAKAAASGLGDTATVADAVTSAMNSYGQEAMSATHATNVLVNTVRFGKGEASTFAPVIGQVAAQAAELGVKFEEVGAALATMTVFGVDASTAAIQLQGVFKALIAPGAQGEKILKNLGTSSEALTKQLGEHGLLSVLATLDKAFAGNTQAARKFFGDVRAFRGVTELVGKNIKTTIRIFDQMKDSTKALSIAFGAVSKDPILRFQAFQAALQALEITIGSALLPVVLDLTDAITKFVGDPKRLEQVKDQVGAIAEAFRDMFNVVKQIVIPMLRLTDDVADGLGGWGNTLKAVIGLWIAFKIAAITAMTRFRVVNGQVTAYTYRSAVTSGLAWVKAAFQAETAWRKFAASQASRQAMLARFPAAGAGIARNLMAPERPRRPIIGRLRTPSIVPTVGSEVAGFARLASRMMRSAAAVSAAWIASAAKVTAANVQAAATSSAAWVKATAQMVVSAASTSAAWLRTAAQGIAAATQMQIHWIRVGRRMGGISQAVSMSWLGTFRLIAAASIRTAATATVSAVRTAVAWVRSSVTTSAASLKASIETQIHWFQVGRRMGGIARGVSMTWVGGFLLMARQSQLAALLSTQAWANFGRRVRAAFAGVSASGSAVAASVAWRRSAAASLAAWKAFGRGAQATARATGIVVSVTARAAATAIKAALISTGIGILFVLIGEAMVQIMLHWKEISRAGLRAFGELKKVGLATFDALKGAAKIYAGTIMTGLLGPIRILLEVMSRLPLVGDRFKGALEAVRSVSTDLVRSGFQDITNASSRFGEEAGRKFGDSFRESFMAALARINVAEGISRQLDEIEAARGPRFERTGIFIPQLLPGQTLAGSAGYQALLLRQAKMEALGSKSDQLAVAKEIRDFLLRMYRSATLDDAQQKEVLDAIKEAKDKVKSLMKGVGDALTLSAKQEFAQAKAAAVGTKADQLVVARSIRNYIQGIIDAGKGGLKFLASAFQALQQVNQQIAQLQADLLVPQNLLLAEAKAAAVGTQKQQQRVAAQIAAAIKRQIDSGKFHGDALIAAYNRLAQYRKDAAETETDAVNKHAEMLKDAIGKVTDAINEAKSRIGDLFGGPLLEPTTKQTMLALGAPGFSIEQLTQDVAAQTRLARQFNQALARITRRGAPGSFVEELRAKGVEALPEALTIANAGKAEFAKFLKSIRGREDLAKKMALIELRAERVNLTAKNIVAQLTNAQLKSFVNTGMLPPIHIHLDLDGKEVAEVVTNQQHRNRKRTGNQRRGQQQGH